MPKKADTITDAQKEAIEHVDGPCLVVAGAGTGKTRVITERIAHLILKHEVNPEQIVALTFTDKAAGEMQERLDEILPYGMFGVTTSTFHAFCNELIRRHAFRLGIDPEARLITEADQIAILREHLAELPLENYRVGYHPMPLLKKIAGYVEQAKEARITPEQLQKHAKQALNAAFDEAEAGTAAEYLELANCYEVAEKLYQELNVLTYADLLRHTHDILASSPVALAEEQERYHYLLIDEYQDTNSIQAEIAYLLAGKKANLFVVGDDDQAIYRFRGANVTNILEFKDRYPDAKIVTLTENYRSTQSILDAAYRLIQHNNPHRLESHLGISKQLHGQTDGPAPEYLRFSTGTHEAEYVALQIKQLLDDGTYTPDQIAIIARSHAQLDPFHQELDALGVTVTRSKENNFFEEPSVVQALSYLRFLSHPHNSENLFRLLTGTPFDIPGHEVVASNVRAKKQHLSLWDALHASDAAHTEGLQTTITYLEEALRAHAADTPAVALRAHIHESKWNNRLISLAEERAAIHLNALHRQTRTFELLHNPTTIAAFVDHADRLTASGEDIQVQSEVGISEGGVTLLTAHASKGLEFNVVFVPNLVMKRFPLVMNGSSFRLPSALITPLTDNVPYEEERRLAYVAFTRAKDRLILSAAEHYGTNKTLSKPSPFLTEALALKEAPAFADQTLRGSLLTAPSTAGDQAPLEFPRHISASSLEAFDDNPAVYYEQHVLQILPDEEAMVAIEFGNTVHNTLRDIFNARREQVTIDLVETFTRYWVGEGYATPQQRDQEFALGISMIEKYLSTVPKNFVPAMIEEAVTLTLPDGTRVSGKVDRIDRNPDNSYSVLDYKTGDKNAKQSDVRDNLPLSVYALALTQQNKPVRDLNLLYLRTESMPCFAVTPDFLDTQMQRIQKLVEEMKEAYRTHSFPNTGTRFVR